MLFKLGHKVHDFADDGVFEPRRVADRAEDDVADGAGDANRGRRKPSLLALHPPEFRSRRQFVDGATQISCVAGARRDGAEARQDPVAEIFVDAAAMPLDHQHQPRLVVCEKSDQLLRRKAV
jgi:hypothetical protein